MGFFDNFKLNFSVGYGKEKETAPEPEQTTSPPKNDSNYPPEFDSEIRAMDQVFSEVSDSFQSRDIVAPILGGRRSVHPDTDILPNAYAPINISFPFQLLKVLENLAIYNSHVAQAVENVVTLANTDVETYFADGVSKRAQKQMTDYLKIRRQTWYEHSEGDNSLINDLFAQIATFGCLSAERVVEKDISGVKKIVRVNPTGIRFAYDPKKDIYIPLQEVPYNTKGLRSKYPGFVELNQETYSYSAYRRIGSIPYGIPPFISALESLMMEHTMLTGFKNMVKKMGVLGFLSVLVSMPAKEPNETDDSFRNRLRGRLNEIRPQVEEGYAKGVALGYKGHHEFNVEGNNMNVQGAEGLFKIAKSYVFSGVKQDPNMMGENYSTTETFGRVILAKTTKQMENYQKMVGAFMAQTEYLDLVLAGFRPGYVEKHFRKAMIGDQKREEETEKLRLDNIGMRFWMGYIDQQQAANEAGYDRPALPEPLLLPPGAMTALPPEGKGPENATPDNRKDETKETETENVKVTSGAFGKLLILNGADSPALDYYIPEVDSSPEAYQNVSYVNRVDVNGMEFDTVAFPDKKLYNYAKSYTKQINSKFNKAIENGVERMYAAVKNLDENTGMETLQQVMIYNLLRNWKTDFSNDIKDIVSDKVDSIYDHFRRDKSVFEEAAGFTKGRQFLKEKGISAQEGQSCFSSDRNVNSIRFFTVPEVVFNLLDYRAIEYSAKLDSFYLGKFITDPDTQKRFVNWIKQRYIGENNPLGGSAKEIRAFVEEFGEAVQLEAWKISRIIDTSVNKIRNVANVNYIKQAGITEFEVVEVMDRLTCDWCSHMNGKTFAVEKAVSKVEKAIKGSVEDVKTYTPFATTTKIDDFRKMDSSSLQAAGFDVAPYHPKCRGRIVAVI